MEARLMGRGFLPPFTGEESLAEIPSLALAYLGDAYFELLVRHMVFCRGKAKVKDLHRATVGLVNAQNQAALYWSIEPYLNEEERGVARRGRNTKLGTVPRHVDVQTYRVATGFECLVGYWYLRGNEERQRWLYQQLGGIL